MRFYAGIGSRKTPDDVLGQMTSIASYLSSQDWVLRSGGAVGADKAFERGAGTKKEVFLPWPGYSNFGQTIPNDTRAMALAAQFHLAWDKCSDGTRKLMARNVHVLLGRELMMPVEFVCCWTPQGDIGGGTGHAIRLAMSRKIPVFNMAIEDDALRMAEYLGVPLE